MPGPSCLENIPRAVLWSGDVGGVGWPWHQTVETVLNIQPVNGGFGLDCLGSMFSTEIDLWTQLQLGEIDEQSSNNWFYNN